MKISYSDEKGINKIWFSDDNNPGIIQEERVIVTNARAYNDLINLLRDYSNYDYIGTSYGRGFSSESLVYTLDGALKYSDYWSTHEYDSAGFDKGIIHKYGIVEYRNPKNETYRIVSGNLRVYHDLQLLFKRDSIRRAAKDYAFIDLLVEQIASGTIDSAIASDVIKRAWPDFECFATEGLSCIDFEVVQSYDVDELHNIIATSKDRKTCIEAKEVLKAEKVAKSNAKVLTLARRVNKI